MILALAVLAVGEASLPAFVTPLVTLALVACGVAMLCWYARLPYLITLVVVGVAAGLLGLGGVRLSREAILLLFLPPLLFEGSLHLPLSDLRRYATPVALLALVGTLVTAGGVAALTHLLLGLPWQGALLLGVILAATDPVSVLALFKQLGAPRGLRTLVEGESLFNDGIGIVLYIILLRVLDGGAASVASVSADFLRIALGGIGVGLAAGLLAYRLLAGVDDRQVEVMASLVLAYGAYLGAESLHLSGILAVVTAGLVVGSYATAHAMSAVTRVSMIGFWDQLAYLANSGLFLLMGARAAQALSWSVIPAVLVVFAVMMLARVPAVFGLIGVSNLVAARPARVTRSWATVLWWGGVRGSIPVALALGLPSAWATSGGLALDAVVFGVVIVSLVAQGLSVAPLMRRLGVGAPETLERDYELALAASASAGGSLGELDRLRERREVSAEEFERLRSRLEARRAAAETELGRLTGLSSALRGRREDAARERLVAAGKAAVSEVARVGLIGEDAAREETRRLDDLLDASSKSNA